MTDNRICDACGKPNREQARFCGHCGQPLQAAGVEKSVLQNEPINVGLKPLPLMREKINGPGQNSIQGMNMKSLIVTIVVVALLGLLAYKNPTLESYERFMRQKITEESKTDVEKALGYFFGDFASRFVARQTIRKDYIFLSTYDTEFGGEHLRALGILNTFFLLETPQSFKARK
jgi:hypothetical protein